MVLDGALEAGLQPGTNLTMWAPALKQQVEYICVCVCVFQVSKLKRKVNNNNNLSNE